MELSRLLSKRQVPRGAAFLLALKEADSEAFTSEVGSVETVSEPVNTLVLRCLCTQGEAGRGEKLTIRSLQTRNV